MASTFTVDVVSAERKVLSTEATGLFIRTHLGSMGILPGHQPVLAGLDIGEAHLHLPDGGGTEYIAVHRGYVYYSGGDTAVILADLAEVSHEIDVEHERQQLVKLEKLQAGDGHVDLDLPELMKRAETRLEVAKKANGGAVQGTNAPG